MITLEEITSVDGPEFDSLFLASLPYMEADTFSWEFLQNPTTEEEKREAVRARCQELIDLPSTKGVLWKKDGTPIHIAVGSFNAFDKEYITWVVSLCGPDANNSKSWLFDESYIVLCKNYFLSNWGVVGYKISCVNNSSIMNYHLNKPNAALYYDVVVDSVDEQTQIATISYTYK